MSENHSLFIRDVGQMRFCMKKLKISDSQVLSIFKYAGFGLPVPDL